MKKYTIATVVKLDPYPWFNRMREGINKFGTDTGHDTFLVGPTDLDGMLQAQIIQELLEQKKVDALCVVPFFPQALERLLWKARQHETVVIAHEATNLRNMDYDIEPFNNAVFGAHLMDHLAGYMGQAGEYAVFVESFTSKSQMEWAEGAITRQKERYPRMSLLGKKTEYQGDQTIMGAKTKQLLKTAPTLKGILAIGMPGSPGAGKAIEEEGLREKVMIVGTSLVSVCGPYITNGTVQLNSCWDPANAGYVMNKLAVMVLNGEPIADGVDLDVPGYTRLSKDGKIFYGSAWIDVTKDNMKGYNF